jgi:hypothetical protein
MQQVSLYKDLKEGAKRNCNFHPVAIMGDESWVCSYEE